MAIFLDKGIWTNLQIEFAGAITAEDSSLFDDCPSAYLDFFWEAHNDTMMNIHVTR